MVFIRKRMVFEYLENLEITDFEGQNKLQNDLQNEVKKEHPTRLQGPHLGSLFRFLKGAKTWFYVRKTYVFDIS